MRSPVWARFRRGLGEPAQKPKQENPYRNLNPDSGCDVHKQSITHSVRNADRTIVEEGRLPARQRALRECGEAHRGVARRDGTKLFRGRIYEP